MFANGGFNGWLPGNVAVAGGVTWLPIGGTGAATEPGGIVGIGATVLGVPGAGLGRVRGAAGTVPTAAGAVPVGLAAGVPAGALWPYVAALKNNVDAMAADTAEVTRV